VHEFSDRRNGRSTAGQTRPVKRTAATRTCGPLAVVFSVAAWRYSPRPTHRRRPFKKLLFLAWQLGDIRRVRPIVAVLLKNHRMAQTTFVLWVRWPSCKGYCPVAPHAACERCAAPHVASRGWSAGPQVVPEHWHAARDDVPCRALLERLILERALPGRAPTKAAPGTLMPDLPNRVRSGGCQCGALRYALRSEPTHTSTVPALPHSGAPSSQRGAVVPPAARSRMQLVDGA
jgi:hypothetical protein